MNQPSDKTTYKGEQIIEEILSGRQEALRVMYPRYQKAFLRWARSWNQSFDDDTLIEAYMEAMKVFYTNVITGHLSVLTTTIENYLITIGKNYLMKKYEKSKQTIQTDDFSHITNQVEQDILSQTIIQESDMEQTDNLRKAFAQLGDKCQTLLKLYFYENVKSPEIKERMGYTDENSVYASKSRCLAQLRSLILKNNG
jgi:RNA polymerase sigma factor (sigma-70 family)